MSGTVRSSGSNTVTGSGQTAGNDVSTVAVSGTGVGVRCRVGHPFRFFSEYSRERRCSESGGLS